MVQISPILRQGGDAGQYLFFWCPGCDDCHQVTVGDGPRPRWSYNGDPLRPTFSPSVLVTSGHYVSGQPQPPDCSYCNARKQEDCDPLCYRCHSFIRDGQIQFLSDCTHALAGQTVPIPEWPKPDYGGTYPITL